jgi:hypothetical protein
MQKKPHAILDITTKLPFGAASLKFSANFHFQMLTRLLRCPLVVLPSPEKAMEHLEKNATGRPALFVGGRNLLVK